MKVKIDNSVINESYFPFFTDRKRYQILRGGAGSGKSVAVAQKIVIDNVTREGRKALILRKYGSTLKDSTFEEIVSAIYGFGLERYFEIPTGKKDLTIVNKVNGNVILFRGFDAKAKEKIKSIKGVNLMWLEEATEFDYADWMQLDLRIRGIHKAPVHYILSFNPIDESHWIRNMFYAEDGNSPKKPINPRDICDVSTFLTTYRDNKFLDRKNRKALEDLINKDLYYYNVYARGMWGVIGEVIFSFKVDDIPTNPGGYIKTFRGLDFGFNHANAYIEAGLLPDEKTLCIYDEVYAKEKTTKEFIKMLSRHGVNKKKLMYADSASPDKIKDFKDAGFTGIKPARKGNDSLTIGIDKIKDYNIIIHPRCGMAKREFASYHWAKDKNGNVLDKPVEIFDDTVAAFRYAVYEHVVKGGRRKKSGVKAIV